MAKARAKRTTRAKKKIWLKIYSGKPFNQQVVGETMVTEPSLAIGKPIIVNLMNLTGDFKKQNTNIKFAINNVSEGKAYTRVIGYEMVSAALKRLVRRRSSKVDMSFDAVTADGVQVRIKPFALTRGKTNKSVLTAIRKVVKEEVTKTISNIGFQNILQDIVNHKLQMTMKKQLAKIHPIKIFEIRFLKIKEAKGTTTPKPLKLKPVETNEETSTETKKEIPEETKEEKPVETKKETQEQEPKETKKEPETKVLETQEVSDHAQKSKISDKPTETKTEQADKEPTETKVEE